MSWAEDEGYDAYDPEDMRPSIDFTDGEWTDADGNTKKIKNMELRHIKNCIGVLERTQKEWDYPNGDRAEIRNKIAEFKKETEKRHKFKGKAF